MEKRQLNLESLGKMSRDELAKHGYFSSQQHRVNCLMGPVGIALSSGQPGNEILSSATMGFQKASIPRLTEELAGSECDLLQYGAPQGDPTYRIQLAKFLTRRYGSPVHSDNILCTAGASQGLNFLSTHFFKKGDLVLLEDPTYFLALASFHHDQQLKVVGVSMDESGINPNDLERKLQEHLGDRSDQDQRPFRCLLYLVHCFHNPTGTCTSPERSRKIVELARKYDVLVVCDDVYNLLSWIPADEGSNYPYKCPPRLFSFDDPTDPEFKGHVVSNGSVSKFLGPGLRLGWVEAPDRIIDMLMKNRYLISSGSFNHVTGGIVGTMLKMGLVDSHLDVIVDSLKTSVEAIVDALKKEMPPEVKYTIPQGGFFLWLEVPKSIDVANLSQLCQSKYKVNFAPGKKFSLNPNFNNCIRLSYSYYPQDRVVEGVKRLSEAVREMMKLTSA